MDIINWQALQTGLEVIKDLPIAPQKRDRDGKFLYLERNKEDAKINYFNQAVFICQSGKPELGHYGFDPEAGISADYLSWCLMYSGAPIDTKYLMRNPSEVKNYVRKILRLTDKQIGYLSEYGLTVEQIKQRVNDLKYKEQSNATDSQTSKTQ